MYHKQCLKIYVGNNRFANCAACHRVLTSQDFKQIGIRVPVVRQFQRRDLFENPPRQGPEEDASDEGYESGDYDTRAFQKLVQKRFLSEQERRRLRMPRERQDEGYTSGY
ncbi:hypothetical protein CEXT_201421 [Caerostris extrusa]|uniref:Uncharacterized protein n=1 Tax=Caerostris extrusa TaxID=172846 RepID=A0AAV4P095_CAEEX|nr:hypothetical protein CEXT_201421 [Caerostris extrusa]